MAIKLGPIRAWRNKPFDSLFDLEDTLGNVNRDLSCSDTLASLVVSSNSEPNSMIDFSRTHCGATHSFTLNSGVL